MYKSQYTPAEAQEQLKLNDESHHHQARKDRVRRFIERRIAEDLEPADN
jgi:hypothetical protein